MWTREKHAFIHSQRQLLLILSLCAATTTTDKPVPSLPGSNSGQFFVSDKCESEGERGDYSRPSLPPFLPPSLPSPSSSNRRDKTG